MPNLSQTPDTFDQFKGLMDAHNRLIEKMTKSQKSPIDQGAFLDEWLSEASSPLTLLLNIDRPAIIEKIIISFTPVNTATLVIGQSSGTNRNIPIPSTNTAVPIMIDCYMIVRPGDSLVLTCASATAMYLEVMGKLLTGTDWSLV